MKKVFIIAEAGVNHNGSMELAKKLIDVAVESGADCVKFQTGKPELGLTKHVQKASYQVDSTGGEESQLDMIKKLELPFDRHQDLIDYCNEKGIMFLSTPFDLPSVDLLDSLGLKIFKIPSGEVIHYPYLKKIGSLNKQIILSTGMATMGEIEAAINVLVENGTDREKITILHANTEYPTPVEDVNLNAMVTIGNTFKLPYGYSDHTLGIEVDIAAVAMGATVIEKHFTLDNTMEGPDHQASLEPDELKAMVTGIRKIEKALGDGVKRPSKSEAKNIPIARKSIVAYKPIKKGEVFSEENLICKRAGIGTSPMRWDEIIGTVATKDYEEDDKI